MEGVVGQVYGIDERQKRMNDWKGQVCIRNEAAVMPWVGLCVCEREGPRAVGEM